MTVAAEKFSRLLGETHRLWRARLDQRLKPLGLSQARWLAIFHLARGGDGLTQTELAGRIGIEGPTLVRLLDRLTASGHIERRGLPHDRRCKTVHLSRKARGLLKKMIAVADSLREELLQDIPQRELETGGRLLLKLKKRLEAAKP
ncbi:MAG TPA: MarR family transcriptional regulator [Gammaproteobacteria bacterium]|nr:MarR family transcriptional regulator [Gammaproteobacteria bacterium]